MAGELEGREHDDVLEELHSLIEERRISSGNKKHVIESVIRDIRGTAPPESRISPATIRRIIDGEYTKKSLLNLRIILDCYKQSLNHDVNILSSSYNVKLLNLLNGSWLLVCYNVKPDGYDGPKRENNIRTAVLRYGKRIGEQVEFQIISKTTVWEGRASLYNDKLSYNAKETTRTNQTEILSMFMLSPFSNGNELSHHGVIMSVFHSQFIGQRFPIYASRCLLYKITEEFDGEKDGVDIRLSLKERYVGYFKMEDIINSSELGESARGDLYRAILDFCENGKAPQNEGDIIVLGV